MKLKCLLASALMLCAVSPVFAAKDLGFYAGGYVSNTNLDDKIGPFDESAWGLGAYGGYNFNDSFGLETSVFGTDSFIDGVDLQVVGLTFAPTVRHAFSDTVTVYLKGGVVYQVIASDDSLDDDYQGTGYLLGAGVDISFSSNLAMRVFYEFSEIEPEHDELNNYFANTRMDHYGVGLHWRF
ncbi:porin family protein [Shewanella amazonensis]|uniref:Outer membrane protein, putative n=1 Tax=Shewanella amazonensis (strain ATCC BAA-1098 / SB2B) TaxID=326297 RepID=A1SB74_SHEAM|nr:porin family protein [Shewanella amazonensis]ABM01631.1 outer membrane protein, putative [Shewanella amazonensis SB2B]